MSNIFLSRLSFVSEKKPFSLLVSPIKLPFLCYSIFIPRTHKIFIISINLDLNGVSLSGGGTSKFPISRMDSKSNPQEEGVDQGECVDSEKTSAPSNKVRIKFRSHDVVSAGSSSGVGPAEGRRRVDENPARIRGRRPAGGGVKGYVADLMRNGKLECPVCKKSFLSDKPLYGHMRCHPERDYRGMQPPKKTGSSCSEIADVADSGPPPDLTPRGWSVKGKRGRPKKIKLPEDDGEEEEEKLYNAANSLLLLSELSIETYKSTIFQKSCGHKSTAQNQLFNGDVLSHVCRKCDKGFQSGQALGGHQRCHWQGHGHELASSSSSSTSPAGQQTISKKAAMSAPLLFDLNELPKDDNDNDNDNDDDHGED
ncbi:hypothetical protein V2J09_001706 [Rumex salicifolius]